MVLFRVLLVVSALSMSATAIAKGDGDSTYRPLMQKNEKAMQEYAAARGLAPPKVTQYQYGMKMDVAKVVNMTRVDSSCNVQPARMTYKDSNGNLHTLEYRKMGVCRTHG
ncbi:Protein of unknown function [Halopseudomonas litoralis]|uniref:DUF2790 domain-containing protein n=1 Tax=Halopseudomonas litoralis TaxID=797277 RepID=A0A1H1QX10_9GAMM|nr:DUF2790 domain-containing protein [Halopseudomonas litoralis]SDS28034.1 Protein of unknown function [Halopseudomonas litoralis]